MPGLLGFTHDGDSREQCSAILSRMQELVSHHPFYRSESHAIDDRIAAARVHHRPWQEKEQPFTVGGASIWFEGDIYNREAFPLRLESDSPALTDAEFIARLYDGEGGLGFLKRLDGLFTAVIYDRGAGEVHLTADRYGNRFLFYAVIGGELHWGCEAKAMLAAPGFSPKMSRETAAEFLKWGYLWGTKTWLNGVEILPPGSTLTWNLARREYSIERYWSAAEVPLLPENSNLDELAEETGRLIVKAVRRRCRPDEPYGISLSGGMDSRCILASMPDDGRTIHAITFGREGCDDIRLARRVARKRGSSVRHHIFPLTEDNWLAPRFAGVWWTDGQKVLLHMHAISKFSFLRTQFYYNFDGYLAGGLLGGLWLGDPAISEVAKLENRARRFINEGNRLGDVFIMNRLPYADNEFVDFTLSIPPNLRMKYRTYNRAVMSAFSPYFWSIPWQWNGMLVWLPDWLRKAGPLWRRAKLKAGRMLKPHGINIEDHYRYENYTEWMRTGLNKLAIERLLFAEATQIGELVDASEMASIWNRHLAGENLGENVCRYLTLETFLRQIHRGELREATADLRQIAGV